MHNSLKIEIYTRDWCPYCRKAKAFFESKDVNYKSYDIAEDKYLKEMETRTKGSKTVPQIFINNSLIGGYDDLINLENQGKLHDDFKLPIEKYEEQVWDLVIIGAGPAGLSAAIYAVRKGLKVLILATALGGQVLETDRIENYIGIINTSGAKLMQDFWQHLKKYEVATKIGAEVEDIKINNQLKILKTKAGEEIKTRGIIIASGTNKRHLGALGENEFKNKGVHYCAICDGYMYAGKKVAIIGGGNSGLEASLDMAKLNSQVVLIEINDSLVGDNYLQEQVYKLDSIEVLTSQQVMEIKGEDKVNSIVLRQNNTGKQIEINLEAVFVEIGLIPNSGFVSNLVDINERKEIIINENNETNVQGVWAAGDVTNIKDKQIIVAAAEGAKAALRVNEYLN